MILNYRNVTLKNNLPIKNLADIYRHKQTCFSRYTKHFYRQNSAQVTSVYDIHQDIVHCMNAECYHMSHCNISMHFRYLNSVQGPSYYPRHTYPNLKKGKYYENTCLIKWKKANCYSILWKIYTYNPHRMTRNLCVLFLTRKG